MTQRKKHWDKKKKLVSSLQKSANPPELPMAVKVVSRIQGDARAKVHLEEIKNKFINLLMRNGEKSKASKLFALSLNELEKKSLLGSKKDLSAIKDTKERDTTKIAVGRVTVSPSLPVTKLPVVEGIKPSGIAYPFKGFIPSITRRECDSVSLPYPLKAINHGFIPSTTGRDSSNHLKKSHSSTFFSSPPLRENKKTGFFPFHPEKISTEDLIYFYGKKKDLRKSDNGLPPLIPLIPSFGTLCLLYKSKKIENCSVKRDTTSGIRGSIPLRVINGYTNKVTERSCYNKLLKSNILYQAIENIKPTLELRRVRKGGTTYQVPAIVNKKRQERLAIKWIIEEAYNKKKKNKKSFSICLLSEILEAFHKTGKPRQRRDEQLKIAEYNRAYTRYRWW